MGIKYWFRDKKNLVFILLVLALLTMPFVLTLFRLTLLGKFLCYAIVALGIDLIWGYTGILSLGHGVFFGLGAYAMAMHLKLVASDSSLPEFMVTGGLTQLPAFWKPFASAPFAFFAVIALPLLLAFIVGFSTFKNRIKGVYFSIITQALTYAAMLLFFRNETGFGGNNGFTGFKTLLGFSVNSQAMHVLLFALSGLALLGCFLFSRWLIRSKYGRVLQAVRDAESRTMFCGYNPLPYKLSIWVISAMMCGLAGALYVPQVGIINPGEFSPLNSIEIVVCVALGGRGRLYGAVLGAFAVNAFKTWFTAVLPEAWLFALGGMFVLVTIFLPQGLAGLPDQWRNRASRGTATHAPAGSAGEGGAA